LQWREQKTIKKRKRSRSLRFERLERRECLTFTHTWVGTQLQFDETEKWIPLFPGGFPPFGSYVPADTHDTLKIYGGGGTIWYDTGDNLVPAGSYDTGVAVPTAGSPISILISGRKGNDSVDLQGGITGNLAGFPYGSVTSLRFNGHEDNDEFLSPTGVVLAPPFGHANIHFDGGAGNDTLVGGGDPEEFLGGSGTDTANAGAGNDFLHGGPDDDTLNGDDDDDTITGDGGADTLNGGNDNDTIDGGTEVDTIDGGDGDDTLNGNEDNDLIWGGDGNDTINTGTSGPLSGGLPLSPPGGPYFEIAYGGFDDDQIDASLAGGTTYLAGNTENDFIIGSEYNDRILGGEGIDFLFGEGGNDTIDGDEGDDKIEGGEGSDTIHGGTGDDLIFGGTQLTPNDGVADLLYGDEDDDYLWGDDPLDTHVGGAGVDHWNGAFDPT